MDEDGESINVQVLNSGFGAPARQISGRDFKSQLLICDGHDAAALLFELDLLYVVTPRIKNIFWPHSSKVHV